MGHQRAHAPFLREGERLMVARFGGLDISGIAISGDLAEKPQGIRFVPPFLLCLGDGSEATKVRKVA